MDNNSHITSILSVYEGVIDDISASHTMLAPGLQRDYERLVANVRHRGLQYLLVDLPALGKWFDHSLSAGYCLPLGDLPFKRHDSLPLLWKGVLGTVFDRGGRVKANPDFNGILYYRTLCYLAKKYKSVPCPSESVKEAVIAFYNTDTELPLPRKWWNNSATCRDRVSGNPLYGGPNADFLPSIQDDDRSTLQLPVKWSDLQLLAARILCSGEAVDIWSLRPNHGPGAVSDTRGKRFKYDFPHWPERLEELFPYDWFGSGILADYDISRDEVPSKLISVPKTYTVPRLICSEMTCDQWVQQSLLHSLKSLIRISPLKASITLHDQKPSQERALSASLDQSHCTIDLSSASDRLSANLVEYIFDSRQDYLDMFRSVRNRHTSQDITSEVPTWFPIRKFSAQGSALTFPVQSIVFCILTMWAICLHRGYDVRRTKLSVLASQVTVFGDDIIAPNDCYTTVRQVLETCGLRVNHSKSFFEGNFRESCGMDAYKGHDVTPAYVTRTYTSSPESTEATLATSNNLFEKGFWRAADVLASLVGPHFPVIGVEGITKELRGRGLASFCGASATHLKSRWCSNLQRMEYRMVGLISKNPPVLGSGIARLSQNFFEIPADQDYWNAGSPGRAILKKRMVWA